MSTSKITSKGQITLPRDVRQALGLAVGYKVDFVEIEGGFKIVPLRKEVRGLKRKIRRPCQTAGHHPGNGRRDCAIGGREPRGMIGLDTNVLIRYLTKNDPDEAARTTRVTEQELTEDTLGFIGLVVLVETAWVLQWLYRASAEEIRETATDLLESRAIVVEERDVVTRALGISRQNACGFADALIAASAFNAGCDKVISFDRRAVRAGMSLVE